MCIPIICSVRAIFSMLSAAKKAWRACPIGWMRQDKTTGTVKPVPVFYAVLFVGRILSLSRTSFYNSVCCFVFFFAVVTEAISFLLITLQFSEFYIARDSKHTVSTWLGCSTKNILNPYCTREWWNAPFPKIPVVSNLWKAWLHFILRTTLYFQK